MSILLSKQLIRAKSEGRVCERCGWMITVKNWRKGYRVCAGCWDAYKGVNVSGGHGKFREEPRELTGEN